MKATVGKEDPKGPLFFMMRMVDCHMVLGQQEEALRMKEEIALLVGRCRDLVEALPSLIRDIARLCQVEGYDRQEEYLLALAIVEGPDSMRIVHLLHNMSLAITNKGHVELLNVAVLLLQHAIDILGRWTSILSSYICY